jgi:phage tail-like protein
VRAAIEDLEPSRSLALGLPAAFFGNDFTHGLVSAFDEVLAPVFATLDDLDAYLDPRYAPSDFVRWLAGWLGFPVDERWPAERIREHLADARNGVLWRGTIPGIAAAVRAYTGATPQISDGGGVSWSTRPMGALPGEPRAVLVVRVTDPDGSLDPAVIDRIVAESKPAQIPHEIQIVGQRR